jgi:NAD(P)-dependent dehydrogenase (short-subunit alcohol dehydrogenase family)
VSKILITGSGDGLGAALFAALESGGHQCIDFDHKLGHDVRNPIGTFGNPPFKLDVLINCAGINKIGYLSEFSEQQWDDVMDTNAKGIFTMSKWAYPQLKAAQGTILNIVSNASHMPMTASAAYNASKGAAHILTLQLARELGKKDGITVFGISPNKLKGTGMSADIEEQVVKVRGWTPEYAREYQLNSLPAGEETDPDTLAEFVAFLLSSKQRHKYLAQTIIPYGC